MADQSAPPPYQEFAPVSVPYPSQQYPYVRGQQQDQPSYPSPGQQYLVGQPYPSPGQQYTADQPYPFPGQQYPEGQPYPSSGQQYPAGQPYPSFGQQYPAGQPYPSSGQQYPADQPYPSSGQQYPVGPYPPNASFAPYGPPPVVYVPGPMNCGVVELSKVEDTQPILSCFTDKAVRGMFIRKLYSILMLQLLFTLAVVALFVFEPHTKFFVTRNPYLLYLSYFMFLGVTLALYCCGNLRRQYPTNIILLLIFTICMSYMLGTMSSFYNTDLVLRCVGICAGVCLAVSVFSFHSKFDFTSCRGMLLIFFWVLFLFGMIAIFTRYDIMINVYAGLGALLLIMFLAYDTQMLMGGKKYEISPEEYIFAVIQIYLDIMCIYMFFVMICSFLKK